jgi:protein subunit release factor B
VKSVLTISIKKKTNLTQTVSCAMKKREKLFSVTAADCDWDVFRGSGNGGQKKQKTSSGVRCTHRASGAVGKATDLREQSDNRRLAFERMCQTPEFQSWITFKIEAAKGNVEIEEQTDQGSRITRKLRVDEV